MPDVPERVWLPKYKIDRYRDQLMDNDIEYRRVHKCVWTPWKHNSELFVRGCKQADERTVAETMEHNARYCRICGGEIEIKEANND